MKIIILTVLGMVLLQPVFSQNPKILSGSNPRQQPAPENLRLLTPPDLRVEELCLVSIVRDEALKTINIRVSIRIKNYGELRTGASTALAYIKSPAGTGAQRTLSTTFPTSPINPGASFVKVLTFGESESFFRPGNFVFWLKADARNTVTESNETNNTSTVISIAVPAR